MITTEQLQQGYSTSVLNVDSAFDIALSGVWQDFGYTTLGNTKRFILNRSGLKELDHNTTGLDLELFRMDNAYVVKEKDEVYLSLWSYKFALARANTAEGEASLTHLLRIEAEYIRSLNAKLLQPANVSSELYQTLADQQSQISYMKSQIEALQSDRVEAHNIKQLKLFKPDTEQFSRPLQLVHDVIKYKSVEYLKSVVAKHFTKDVDYSIDALGDWHLTEACMHELVIVARPQAGAKVSSLPEWLLVSRDRMFKAESPINGVFGKRG